MEKKTKRYEFEGIVLDVPMHYDELADMYIENYWNFIENPVWTKDGHPVTESLEEACPYSEWGEPEEPGRCTECGSCRYYTPAAPHSMIGVCRHRKRLWADRQEETESKQPIE